MTNAERLKLINNTIRMNSFTGKFPSSKHELSKALFGNREYIYRNYPVTYITFNDNEDIRAFFKKIERCMKIDLKTNEPLKTKRRSFLKDYVYNCLNTYGNTIVSERVYHTYGKDKILKELAEHGLVCELKESVEQTEYKHTNRTYILILKSKI